MRTYQIRFFILFLITSFTVSIVVGCGGRQRRQTRRLESRVDSIEKRAGVDSGITEKRIVERVDSMEKRITDRLAIMEKRIDDLETLKERTKTLEGLLDEIQAGKVEPDSVIKDTVETLEAILTRFKEKEAEIGASLTTRT